VHIAEALAIAVAHHRAGRYSAAEQIYDKILEVEPDHAHTLNLRGALAHHLGQDLVAVGYLERALALAPDVAEYHNNLGEAYRALGNLDRAAACYRRAAELRPELAECLNNLANVVQLQGNLAEAVGYYRRALQLRPDFAEAHSNLGAALRDQGRLAEAADCFRRALQLRPQLSDAYHNLGNVLLDQERFDEAVACYRRSLQLRPDQADGYNNLGNALRAQGKLDESLACLRRSIELRPDFAEAHNNLGNTLKEQGRTEEALGSYRRAVELRPTHAVAHCNALCCEQFRPGVTLAGIAAAHRQWERQHAEPLRPTWQPHPRRDPQRKLRLGFVSNDFGQHPVGYFLVRTLEALAREPVETLCYCGRPQGDDLTARFRAAAGTWREVCGISHAALAEQIRADAVDILFDLAGHTGGNRLLVFARKPAPIQITWIGYFATTGLAAMDYILADGREIPPAAEVHYRERVLRMPDGYVCYDPPDYAPAVSRLPALDAGQVTFGNFNNPGKITPQAVEVWSRILRRVPGARMVLKYKGLDDPTVTRRFAGMFAAQGIDPARLDFRGWSPHAELLGQYRQIDLALDGLSYSGGLTTCEALWMGVPVITCPGETFASRHSLSHLSSVGLTETVARDLDDYVALAVSLAGDLPRLAAIRARLRSQMAASPLCDGSRFARNLMDLLRDVWRQWCNS
jgi:predicted O-linked N-acetylglucosamine transferase (SPINDLY family)